MPTSVVSTTGCAALRWTQRDAIAAWIGIVGLDSFTATVRIHRTGEDLYDYDATFAAAVTQSCVVTLEPVRSELEGAAGRRFRVVARRPRRRTDTEEEVAPADDDTEVLDSNILDVAAPLLEELALSIDPYPRAPGAAFESPPDPDKPENPFAALERLKPQK